MILLKCIFAREYKKTATEILGDRFFVTALFTFPEVRVFFCKDFRENMNQAHF